MPGMGGMDAGAGAMKAGSANMDGPCYKDPKETGCRDFARSDAGA